MPQRNRHSFRIRGGLIAFSAIAFLAAGTDKCCRAQDDELAAGLLARFLSASGQDLTTRIDPDTQFNWGDSSPDPRVPANQFAVVWRGKLLVSARGQYRFRAFVAGAVQLRIDDQPVIDGVADSAGWLNSGELALDQGHHAIELQFTKTSKSARVGLYWESNKFGLEPIGSRWLFHGRSADREPVDFERGAELVRAYRCAACHAIPGFDVDRKAPSLERVGERIRPDWLVNWLSDGHGVNSDSRMPSFGLTADDVSLIAAFLSEPKSSRPATTKESAAKGRAEVGEVLAGSLGCLACHTLERRGTSGPFGGGSLDRVAEKRSAVFFREWLAKPESVNAAHRMPVFALKKDEIDDLVSFLATRTGPDRPARDGTAVGASEANRRQGAARVGEFRCGACHDIPEISRPARLPVALHGPTAEGRIDWSRSCLGPPDVARRRPGFEFGDDDRRAVQEFIERLPATVATQSRYELGRRLVHESNCTGCHARDLEVGLQPGTTLGDAHRRAETELAALRGELEPPSLTSVGDKFQDTTLELLVHGGRPPRRAWLKVRMPRFDHTAAERDAIVSFLIDHDRIPDRRVLASQSHKPAATHSPPETDSRPAALDPATALVAGHQLVSARGFGCMSCHTVGKHEPKGVAVNARGSDLLKIGDRVRHDWFVRWTRDPARIVPGMEMPAITAPVAGVCDGRLDLQIESLWAALNSAAFVVPSDRETAQQVIALGPGDAPVILRDVMFDCPPGSGWCPRPFAIGLPNRHNLVFDLDTMSLRGWWFGDFARERTEGKTWLWEPAGLPVWNDPRKPVTVAMQNRETGEWIIPETVERYSLKLWRRDQSTVTFWRQLKIYDRRASIVEEISPVDADGSTGFVRKIEVHTNAPRHDAFILFPELDPERDEKLFSKVGPLGKFTVRSGEAANWTSVAINDSAGHTVKSCAIAAAYRPGERGQRVFNAELSYLLEPQILLPGTAASRRDQHSPSASVLPPAPLPAREPRPLSIGPGIDAIRLPLDPAVMPTALTFRPDHSPVVCSLKGQVFAANDTDGDGIEDTWRPMSDHLAAPFGVLADGDDLLISHKPELLRLDGKLIHGEAGYVSVIASGWGYTKDYHDWTFGPVRDSKGCLYLGTGSDYTDKDRPSDARKWRGSILKVSPNGVIEELARGARYPTGLAINRDDQVFFTDNQGVQNTFNEINHVVPGSRYGVPALDDPPADQDPWPERAAAIQIPHPWTRSINGICFLDSHGKWGPFEGHGIGCEYDTRGLIRFSLQRVGETYQGACYPFTLPEDQVPLDDRLLGPICCAVSPNGDLYVGGIRDSGWGGGNNVGELVRVRPAAPVPLGIRELRAWRDGFVIDFTGPVDSRAATNPMNYILASYHRIWKGTYATPDSDRRAEKIRSIRLATDGRSVVLTLESMRPGFVYELHVSDIGAGSESLWPPDAYYTLNQIPDDAAPAQ